MSFDGVFQKDKHIKNILNKQCECIRTIKRNQDKQNIKLIIKKALKNNNYTSYMISMILNNREETKENKNKAIALYVEWLDIMRNYIKKEEKEINKLMWCRIFGEYIYILDCVESEYKEKLKYEIFKTASLLKAQGVKLLEPLVNPTTRIDNYKKYNKEIKIFLKGGKKNQYILPTKVIENRMKSFEPSIILPGCWELSGYFDIFLEYFEKKDTQYLPNLQRRIIETDKVELLEKAIEKNIINAEVRDELLEHALKNGCSKVIKDLILL